MSDWNPMEYLGFQTERAQPIADLIARLPGRKPGVIFDLGCGPGNSTALLRQAFPLARITGLDSSPAMIAKARDGVPSAAFAEADAAGWLPGQEADLVFSNALFQWLPDRDAVIRNILAALRSGAALALQMPDNLDEPSHRLMREVAGDRPWRDRLLDAASARRPLLDEKGYYNLLRPIAQSLDIWRTSYVHALESHEAIARMLSTTGLKPFLDPLPGGERADFLAEYVARLAAVYPRVDDGRVLFRFPRLFIAAIRK